MSNAEKMLIVPRDLLERYVSSVENHNYGFDGDTEIRALLDAPVQQHQGGPVALPARKPESISFYPTGWNDCLDEIAKLGPLYTHADPTSPFEVLAEHCASAAIAEGVKNYRGASYTISRDDGGAFELVITVQRLGAKSPQEVNEELGREVERLRDELDGYKQGSRIEAEEADTLRAQLAEAHALLREIRRKPGLFSGDFILRLDETLSANAEPSAPERKYCGDTGKIMVGRSGDANDGNAPILEPCEDCDRGAPVDRDERALIELALSEYGKATGKHVLPGGINENQDGFVHGFLVRAALERRP